MPGSKPLLPLVLIACCGGCQRYHEDAWSQARPPTYRCTGIVTLGGAPVERAIVTFVTAADSPGGREYSAVGITDHAGRFVLQTFRPADGAVAGPHAVMIEKTSLPGGEPAIAEPSPAPQSGTTAGRAQRSRTVVPPAVVHALPPAYARVETSGLSAEVLPGERNHFHFDLRSSGP